MTTLYKVACVQCFFGKLKEGQMEICNFSVLSLTQKKVRMQPIGLVIKWQRSYMIGLYGGSYFRINCKLLIFLTSSQFEFLDMSTYKGVL